MCRGLTSAVFSIYEKYWDGRMYLGMHLAEFNNFPKIFVWEGDGGKN